MVVEEDYIENESVTNEENNNHPQSDEKLTNTTEKKKVISNFPEIPKNKTKLKFAFKNYSDNKDENDDYKNKPITSEITGTIGIYFNNLKKVLVNLKWVIIISIR